MLLLDYVKEIMRLLSVALTTIVHALDIEGDPDLAEIEFEFHIYHKYSFILAATVKSPIWRIFGVIILNEIMKICIPIILAPSDNHLCVFFWFFYIEVMIIGYLHTCLIYPGKSGMSQNHTTPSIFFFNLTRFRNSIWCNIFPTRLG
ncbi:hypothetical protein ACJX0J_031544, partial [Zea mays]